MNEIEVKVIGKDPSGKIKLSRKALLDNDSSTSGESKETVSPVELDLEVGDIITGKVVNIARFGAFVEIAPGTDGMVHISELENRRVSRVEDVVNVGDEITVQILDINESGKIRLSRKALLST